MTAWLLVLVRAGVTYGYDMRRELAARQLEVDYASVYRMLRQLQRDGRLRSHWGKTVSGPRRRLYEITPAGRQALAAIADQLEAISRSHQAFLENYVRTPEGMDGGAPSGDELPVPAAAQDGLLALDELALAVADPDAMLAFLRRHVGMHELERSADWVLVGADPLATKLRLLAAEGPREAGALSRLVFGVADLQRAVTSLPSGTETRQDEPGEVAFEGPEGLGLGFALATRGIDYDLDRVILRAAYPQEATVALTELGCVARDGALYIADKRIMLEELPAWAERPLLDHISVHVGSVEPVRARARRHGLPIEDAETDDAITIVLPGLEQISFRFVKLAAPWVPPATS